MEILVYSMVLSYLDYANGIFTGVSNYIMKKLQVVQNWAAKLILNKQKLDSATDCLINLHWLPIQYHIQFKVILLVKKCLCDSTPEYLKELLKYNYRRYAQCDGQKLITLSETSDSLC